MQPNDPNYKPKTTIIPANPNIFCDGQLVVAWVIEDGQVARAVTLKHSNLYDGDTHVSSALLAWGADE